LINWAAAAINWNLYGAADSSLSPRQVFANMVHAAQAQANGG